MTWVAVAFPRLSDAMKLFERLRQVTEWVIVLEMDIFPLPYPFIVIADVPESEQLGKYLEDLEDFEIRYGADACREPLMWGRVIDTPLKQYLGEGENLNNVVDLILWRMEEMKITPNSSPEGEYRA
ncbi:MAG: hypothetical protein DRJ40_11830 [Thermoprotei archaeon]|nr:MAG: hypothetical protein DRJ40_11830 [Thermoprotei archaeon]